MAQQLTNRRSDERHTNAEQSATQIYQTVTVTEIFVRLLLVLLFGIRPVSVRHWARSAFRPFGILAVSPVRCTAGPIVR